MNKILQDGSLSEEKASEIDRLAKEEADASAEFASASPFPEPHELMDDIYWETDKGEPADNGSTMFFETP